MDQAPPGNFQAPKPNSTHFVSAPNSPHNASIPSAYTTSAHFNSQPSPPHPDKIISKPTSATLYSTTQQVVQVGPQETQYYVEHREAGGANVLSDAQVMVNA